MPWAEPLRSNVVCRRNGGEGRTRTERNSRFADWARDVAGGRVPVGRRRKRWGLCGGNGKGRRVGREPYRYRGGLWPRPLGGGRRSRDPRRWTGERRRRHEGRRPSPATG